MKVRGNNNLDGEDKLGYNRNGKARCIKQRALNKSAAYPTPPGWQNYFTRVNHSESSHPERRWEAARKEAKHESEKQLDT